MGAEYIINNNFNVMLKGRDPLEIQSILADFNGYRRINLGGPPSVVFIKGGGGPYLTAVSGLEMALWDLAGKALGLPIHQLLGGKIRSKLPVYLHAANPKEGREVVNSLKVRTLKVGLDYSNDDWSINKGFEKGKRFGLHMTNNQIDDTVNFFGGFRKELGLDTELGLELHAHYDLEAGLKVCQQVEQYRPLFVEEPTTSDNVESMLRIRNNTRVPIAAGENDPDRGEAIDAKWESCQGHASAALRYGLLSPDRSSVEPRQLPADPREARMVERLEKRAEVWKRKQRSPSGLPEW
jgi:galactonate dehydratase